MSAPMTDAFTWLSPWYPTDDPRDCSGLEGQLKREVSADHVLSGEAVRLLARRSDTDDALFELADVRVAEVHLTWRRTRETDPRWPGTVIFRSLEEWGQLSMEPLHQALSADR